MTPQELKNSILQLAIQGKLVEQRAEEGTGAELLEKILAAKNAECAKGKGEKSHAKSAKSAKVGSCVSREVIPDDEKSFDIPESWEWVRLGEIADINGGFAFKSTNYTSKGVRVIRISDFIETGFVNDKIVRYSYDETLKPYILEEKNILLCMTGGTVGKSLFVPKMNELMVVNQRVAMIKVRQAIPEYVYKIILAPITQKVIQDSKNSTNDNISMDTIKGFLIPLPPLAEQKRIVAKIEELLPLIDRYEKAWSRLEDFNKRFPVDMHKSLLQMAIQGKLVEQRSEEGTGEELYCQIQAEKQRLIKSGKIKKEKPLPAITEDEIPFDIPDSWKWVRLGQLGNTNIGLTYGPKDVCDEGVVVLRSSNIQNGKMDYADIVKVSCSIPESKMCHVGDILICARNGSKRLVGKAALIDRDGMSFGAFMAIFRSCCNAYVLYVINSAYFRNALLGDTGTTTINQITQDVMKNMLIPLPPLAEQKRIVAKLEELLPLCERLK